MQDPQAATAPSMPLSAIEHVAVDFCLPLDSIVETLIRLAGETVEQADGGAATDVAELENQFMSTEDASMAVLARIAQPSPFTCPECHGSLWEVEAAKPQRFRCHTGHSFTARTLASVQKQAAEEAIWAAVRALHEKESLLRQFAKDARDDKRTAEHAQQHAAALRRITTE